MRNYIHKYFYHTRSERLGTLLLLSCICLSVAIRYVRLSNSSNVDAHYSKALALQSAALFGNDDTEESSTTIAAVSNNFFNPNEASLEELMAAGMPPRVANILIHYREKGGYFKTAADLKKVYGITPTLFAALEPRILLSEPQQKTKNFVKNINQEIEAQRTVILKNFNPNTVTEEALLEMGLEKRVVKIWLNYRKAGKIFTKKQDVEKIYGISSDFFLKIENYIQFDDNQVIAKNSDNIYKLQNRKIASSDLNFKLNLNTASMDELLRLHGIGRIFASRIVKYREDLGGFVTVNQLKEIENFPDSTFNALVPLLIISGKIQELHVNKLNTTETKHPYLTKKQVLILQRYKINHGDLQNVADVSKTGCFTDKELEKIKPYLAYD